MEEPLQDASGHAAAEQGTSGGVSGPEVGSVFHALSMGMLSNGGMPAFRAQPVAREVAVQQAGHEEPWGGLGSPSATEALSTCPISGDALTLGALLDPEHIELGSLGAREGNGVVRGTLGDRMSFNSNRSSCGRGSGILKPAGCPGESQRKPTTHSLCLFWGTP